MFALIYLQINRSYDNQIQISNKGRDWNWVFKEVKHILVVNEQFLYAKIKD